MCSKDFRIIWVRSKTRRETRRAKTKTKTRPKTEAKTKTNTKEKPGNTTSNIAENSASKVTDSNGPDVTGATLTNANQEKVNDYHTGASLKEDSMQSYQKNEAKQSFQKNTQNTLSENNERVGLMNEEQSLALMTAIGNDLQKSLAEKFHGDVNIIDDPLETKHQQPHHDVTYDIKEKPITEATSTQLKNTAKDDQKQLTSYFLTENKKPSLGKEISIHDSLSLKEFFDWTQKQRNKLLKQQHETKEFIEIQEKVEKTYK